MTESMSTTEILRLCAERECGECCRIYNEFKQEDGCRRDLCSIAADTIDRLTAENARLDEELGRCTSGNGTYISLESHDRILAKLTADLLQKTQQLTETNKALESDNYNAEMNLSRLTERLAAAVKDLYRIAACDACKHYDAGENACGKPYVESYKCFEWRGEESE